MYIGCRHLDPSGPLQRYPYQGDAPETSVLARYVSRPPLLTLLQGAIPWLLLLPPLAQVGCHLTSPREGGKATGDGREKS